MKISRSKFLFPSMVLLGSVGIAAVLLATAPRVASIPKEAPLVVVRVLRADPQPIALTVRSHGSVSPRTESEIVPEISGKVVWTSPALVSGGFFDDAEVLLRIDRYDYEVQLRRAEAGVARARSELDHARANRQRIRGLANKNAASTAQQDEARRGVQVAEAVLEEAQAGLSDAKRSLERTEIAAPYAGRVRDEQVDVGQFVSRGKGVATLYATDYVEVRLPIADDQLAFLDLPLWGQSADRPNPSVILTARFAGEEHTWQGTIVRTEGEIDPMTRMVNVVARIEDPYGNANGKQAASAASITRPPLALGLFVSAAIAGPIVENVVVVPRSALRDGDRVLIVDAEDRLRERKVEVLRIDREDVLVRGIERAERVCISPLQIFVEGMTVRVFNQGRTG